MVVAAMAEDDGGANRFVVVARTVAPPLLREWRKMVALSR